MPALFVEVTLRAALLGLGTAAVLWAFRIRSATVRHAAWTAVVVAMLILPAWSTVGPRVPLRILPASDFLPALNVLPADPATESPTADAGTAALAVMASRGPSRGTWLLTSVYVVGLFMLLFRLGIGTAQAQRLRRTAVSHADRATSAHCATPITVGWLSPSLILPEGWQQWSAAQLDAVLIHEREHARRRDPLVQWLALLNRAIFWFHPLAWWLERRLAILAEEACDAAVVRAGHAPQDYCGYLVDMAQALKRQGRRVNIAGMAMPGSGLSHRMRQIFEEGSMTPTPRARVICTFALCALSSVVFGAGMLAPRTSAGDVPGPVSTPDFSGNWTHASSTYAGRGRGGTGTLGVEREVRVTIHSGAPVNCGTACTIVQDASTLTLSRTDQPGTTPPDNGPVVLNLDGSESTITQVEGSTFPATAKWEGEKLVVTRGGPYSGVTQVLSMVNGQLTVVTRFTSSDAPVTMKYVRR